MDSFWGHGLGYPWWPALMGWILPLLLVLGMGALVTWGVLRATERGRGLGEWRSPAARPGDSALEQARLRYARGEVAREEFLQIAADLRADSPAASSGSSRDPAAQPGPEEGSSRGA